MKDEVFEPKSNMPDDILFAGTIILTRDEAKADGLLEAKAENIKQSFLHNIRTEIKKRGWDK